MTAYKGRDMLLKLGAAGAGGTIAGLRETTLRVNNDMVDVTNKDSNGYRLLLAGAGVRSFTITANGTADNGSTFETLQGNALTDTGDTYYLTWGDGDAIEGTFAITSFEIAGGYSDAQTFSITLESSGQLTLTQA
jgi:TP901-1 family phage major tail protein